VKTCLRIAITALLLCSCWCQSEPTAAQVQKIEAEDGHIVRPAMVDRRGHDSGGASVHLGGKPGGYVEITSELPYDVYYIFVRARAGTFEDPHYGDQAYKVHVGRDEYMLSAVKGTLELAGDADNWVWFRTTNAVPIGKGNVIRIDSNWVYGMVDLIIVSKDPEHIAPKEEIDKSPVLTALKVSQAPVVDGVLDEPCWKAAPVAGEFNRRDGDGRPTQKTHVQAVWTDEVLYVAMVCFDQDMSSVVAHVKEHDGPVYNDDSVEVFLDTNYDRRSFFHLSCNAAGTRADDLNYEDGASWDGAWQARTRRFDDRWQVEIAVPFKSLNVKPRVGTIWGANFYRCIKSPREEVAWSCPFGLPLMGTRFGKLVFADSRTRPYLQIESFQVQVRNNRIEGKVINSSPSDKQVQLSFELVDDKGVAMQKSLPLSVKGKSSQPFEFTFDTRQAGTQMVMVSVKDGDIVCKQVLVDELPPERFVPFAAVLPQPYYSTEKQVRLKVYVNLPADEIKDGVVKSTLKKDENIVSQKTLSAKGGKQEIIFDIDQLPRGNYLLETQLLNADGHRLGGEDHQLTLLPKPKNPSKVRIDDKNRLWINGKLRFPIVLVFARQDGKVQTLGADSTLAGGEWVDMAAEAGISRAEALKKMSGMLDSMYDLGLMYVPHVCAYFRNREDYDALRATVSGLKDHPALLAWYTFDEPLTTGTLPGQMARARRIIGQIDPDHPVFGVSCHPKVFRLYAPSADVFGSDPYPVPSRPLKMVSQWTDISVDAMGEGPVWMCLQTHGPPVVERCPTKVEFRNMNYQAIIHGSMGLMWWCYSFMNNTAGMVASGYFNEYKKIISEIRTLEPVLLNGEKGKLEVRPNGVHSLTKHHDGGTYILAANVTEKAADCTFDANGKSAEVLFENRKLSIEQGRFSDRFDGYAVHVYRIAGR